MLRIIFRLYSQKTDVSNLNTLAIRRETQSAWERRAPLSPVHVKALCGKGLRVLVQPSNRRAYPMDEYAKAGAIIQEDISEASLIVGVKRPADIDELIDNKTYVFFSHTHKAQADNMGLLDAILEKNIRLIDYEKMVDENHARVIAFGKYAGVAGMINILHGLGLRLLALGHHTPFMNVGLAHNYRNSNVARQAIRDVGYQIALGYMPKSIGPLTFIFTGSGNVSQGAREVFNELPHEYIHPETLPKVLKYGKMNKIYACVISREHHLVHKQKGTFDAEDYDKNPKDYISMFSSKIAPYANVIINGIYWAPDSPKLITIPAAKTLLQASDHIPHRERLDFRKYYGRSSLTDAPEQYFYYDQPNNNEQNKGDTKYDKKLYHTLTNHYYFGKNNFNNHKSMTLPSFMFTRKKNLQPDSTNPFNTPSSSDENLSKASTPNTLKTEIPGCPNLPHRLLAICDISADPGGSIEFMSECTTIDKPFCLYDADQNKNTESFTGDGVLVCSIDNMPTQLPLEATDFFGGLLLPFIPNMVKLDANLPFEEISTKTNPIIVNAIIASNGSLTPNFAYIDTLRRTKRQSFMRTGTSKRPNVLILGSGYVSAPVVEYLTRDKEYELNIVSPWRRELDKLVHLVGSDPEKQALINPHVLNIDKDAAKVENLISKASIVVSLLPYNYHVNVAQLCIKHGKNMVTTSYLSNDMRLLEPKIKESNICIVNECGLDPGIDHMLAMEVIDELRENRKQIISFKSFCGGLPAPEYADNPLHYKFSWYPKGVLLNSLSATKYLLDEKVYEIPAGGAIMDNPWPYEELPAFNLESFPNRDSTIYINEYGIPEVKTLIRGTLRYKGFCDVIKGFHLLGLFDSKQLPYLGESSPSLSWKMLMCNILNKPGDIMDDTLRNLIYEKVGRNSNRVQAFEKLGMLSDSTEVEKKGSLIDSISHYLAQTLSYKKGEKDLIILRHNFNAIDPYNGSQEIQEKSVTLIVYGEPNGHTAMAKCVGFPCAIIVKMILEGEIQDKGLVLPMQREFYKPILNRLKAEGISAKTSTQILRNTNYIQQLK